MTDSRFEPMQLDELPDLSVSTSVLHSFEHIDDPFDWEIGVHGLTIDINDNGEVYRGTFLPNVATEQGFNRL